MSEAAWSVEFYRDAHGMSPALDFMESLQARERASMARAIALLQRYGPLLKMPHARHLGNDLWELRAGSGRVLYFLFYGRRFVLLHGYRKKTDKAPRKELAAAMRYMAEFIERHEHER